MERSNSFLSRLRGSFRSKRSAAPLLTDEDLEGDVCVQCRQSALVAHRAAYFGHVPCLAWLAREEPEKLDGVDRNGATPLLLAVRQNRIKAVGWLLANYPDQGREKATGGETPVLVAAALGRLKCLELLLEFDSRIKSSLAEDIDSSGLSAVHLATLKNRVDTTAWIVKVLGKSAVVHPTKSGITAVHIAAASGHLPILQLLTKKEKKGVFFVDSAGTTPVYFAAQEGRLECLRHMVESVRADAIARCDDGMTTVHCAAQGGHLHVVQWLVTSQGEHVVLAKTQDGATPVHFAAAMGHVELLEWILSLPKVGGLAKDTVDLDGGTPAHDAADNSQLQCLAILKSHGADLTLTDNDGFTAIDLAVNSSDSKCREWGVQMMRDESWQNTAFTGGDQELGIAGATAAAAAAAMHVLTPGNDDGSPALPTRPASKGLTQDDRYKSTSREINIDDAVFQAARIDGVGRAGTLPNPQRSALFSSSSKKGSTSSTTSSHTDTPYAIPMRLLAKVRSNTVGHRADAKKNRTATDGRDLIRMNEHDGDAFGDEETSLVNTGAIEATDGAEYDAGAGDGSGSPELPPKTAESLVLLKADDSDCDQSAEPAREAEPIAAAATEKEAESSEVEHDAAGVEENKAEGSKEPAANAAIVIEAEDTSDSTDDEDASSEEPLARANARMDAKSRAQTLPERRRHQPAVDAENQHLAVTPDTWRRSISGGENNDGSPLPVRGRPLFVPPSPNMRARKPSPSPLPDARDSPLMKRRMESTKGRKASESSLSDYPPPTKSKPTPKKTLSDSSDDDDNVEDDQPASKEQLSSILSKATTQATKMLITSSSDSSSADESD